MYKVVAFLKRKHGMSRAEFIDYYENHHVPLILSIAPPPPVYRRNYLMSVARGVGFDFDVMTEIAFADQTAFETWALKLHADTRVADDELNFFDPGSCRPIVCYFLDERSSGSG